MSIGMSRRDFIQRAAATGAGVMLVGSTEMLLTTPAASAAPTQIGYGPLVPDRPAAWPCPRASRTRSSPTPG